MNVKLKKKFVKKFFNTPAPRYKKGTAIARVPCVKTHVLRKKRGSIAKHFLFEFSALLRL